MRDIALIHFEPFTVHIKNTVQWDKNKTLKKKGQPLFQMVTLVTKFPSCTQMETAESTKFRGATKTNNSETLGGHFFSLLELWPPVLLPLKCMHGGTHCDSFIHNLIKKEFFTQPFDKMVMYAST